MTTDTRFGLRGRRRIRVLTTPALAALITPIALATITAPTADAEPGPAPLADPASVIDSTARTILHNLPGAPGGPESNGSLDLPSIIDLIPDSSDPGSSDPGSRGPGTATPRADGPATTSCRTVTHIGDSTSVGIDDASKIPTAADRLTPRYRQVGVGTVILDASGGRSIVEKVDGRPNAVDAVNTRRAAGDRGCWVIAMGVNDAANIAVGSTVDADDRIDRIMSRLADQPVLWPTVMTGAPSNPAYAPANMTAFNEALRRAATRYPNLRVYDFARDVQPGWYADGIHYNADGLAARNKLFAAALARSFPG
ncbi:SGNH/GDSL hydrolase family protein [Gordonia shandongensis]|uniref:SGNH/GDSL hydrolase family protein n=1 Tax=Gordonia shandongensis TaxID=376351 RepID=UPI0003FAF272|nr:SGNH/GDSL hydrolase family protein [Gordonia shandongensis]